MSADALLAQMREVDISTLGAPTTEFVYALISNGEIAYIGRTVSLMPRIAAHRTGRGQWKPSKTFDRVFALEVITEDAAALEGALIRRFNPPLCSMAPNSEESRDSEMLARFGLSYDQPSRDAFVARRRGIFAGAQRARRKREDFKARRLASVALWRATKRYLGRIEQQVTA